MTSRSVFLSSSAPSETPMSRRRSAASADMARRSLCPGWMRSKVPPSTALACDPAGSAAQSASPHPSAARAEGQGSAGDAGSIGGTAGSAPSARAAHLRGSGTRVPQPRGRAAQAAAAAQRRWRAHQAATAADSWGAQSTASSSSSCGASHARGPGSSTRASSFGFTPIRWSYTKMMRVCASGRESCRAQLRR